MIRQVGEPYLVTAYYEAISHIGSAGSHERLIGKNGHWFPLKFQFWSILYWMDIETINLFYFCFTCYWKLVSGRLSCLWINLHWNHAAKAEIRKHDRSYKKLSCFRLIKEFQKLCFRVNRMRIWKVTWLKNDWLKLNKKSYGTRIKCKTIKFSFCAWRKFSLT